MIIPLPNIRVYFIILGLAILVMIFGLRNYPDPVWVLANDLVRNPPMMLNQAGPDSVKMLYRLGHPEADEQEVKKAWKLVSEPSVPVLSWKKFNTFYRHCLEEPFVIISGVTGTGSSNLSTRTARLLAGSPGRVLQINCAPEFDLEYHKKYIGQEVDGVFQFGELLKFWDTCLANPHLKYVAIADNFDKINPEAFFGPELWEMLSSSNESTIIGGKTWRVPSNFHFISVTHLGPGSRVELNEEHFKRLGRPVLQLPDGGELLEHLRRQAKKLDRSQDPADVQRHHALLDTNELCRIIFYFLKTNKLIEKRYGIGYQIGQGTNVRRYFLKEELPKFKETFQLHINALIPNRPLNDDDFQDIDYTVANGGMEPNSNFIARQIEFLQETGYLVEITMVAATALLTAFVGWWMFRRREQLIRRYGDRAQQVFSEYEEQKTSADTASRELEIIKREVDNLVLRRRLNYTEGLYFMAFIDDKVRRIEFSRQVTEHFLELFNTFMDDGVLTENEYNKLLQFLQTIQHKIPEDSYDSFRKKAENAFMATLRN